MGCGPSSQDKYLGPSSILFRSDFTPEELEQRNKEIEEDIEAEKLRLLQEVKILMLGGTASGKTTVFKQMRILHLNGFTDSDYVNYKYLIHSNAIQSLAALLDALPHLRNDHKIDHLIEEIMPDIDEFRRFAKAGVFGYYELDPEIGQVMSRLWYSKPVQIAYEANRFDLLESTQIFLSDVPRLADPNYKPSHKDVLYCRFRTTGIYEMNFQFRSLTLRMVDVGGQKSEQKKWIHCFDNVQLVLFVSSLSEYDMKTEDDPEENRMVSNMSLFRRLANNKVFLHTPFLLFLNKKDIFEEKITQVPLKTCFQDYNRRTWEEVFSDKNTFEEATSFILDRYMKGVSKRKTVYVHFTTATDTDNIKVVFDSSMDQILIQNMASSGVA